MNSSASVFGEQEFRTQTPVKIAAFNLPSVLVPLAPFMRMFRWRAAR